MAYRCLKRQRPSHDPLHSQAHHSIQSKPSGVMGGHGVPTWRGGAQKKTTTKGEENRRTRGGRRKNLRKRVRRAKVVGTPSNLRWTKWKVRNFLPGSTPEPTFRMHGKSKDAKGNIISEACKGSRKKSEGWLNLERPLHPNTRITPLFHWSFWSFWSFGSFLGLFGSFLGLFGSCSY